ncbi:MAG: aminopeptidase P family protein [Candidatus Azobacteroides sp.]|nr:aminopeptidase P family protein [Candidatus Azobacteroides sp.]
MSQKIADLRRQMRDSRVQACIIPVSDPHLSEYQPEHWKVLSWITGFTGSAGTFVCTLEKSGLWTDSRYFLQAEQQLRGSEIELFRMGLPATPSIGEWLKISLPEESAVGLDGRLFSVNQVEAFSTELAQKNISLSTDFDPFPFIWKDRPELPGYPLQVYPIEYAGCPVEEKVKTIRKMLLDAGADSFLLTSPDEIAWLFNIRGCDVEYNPVANCFAFISQEEIRLFVAEEKVTPEVREYLAACFIHVSSYQHIYPFLRNLSAGTHLLIDKNRINAVLYHTIPEKVIRIYSSSPVTFAKSIKNPIEIRGFREAMVKDGVALVRFFRWLESRVGKERIMETDIVEKLRYFRSCQPLYKGESFAAIAGYGPNGAIVHYKPEKGTDSEILPEGFLLIDSGGQYLDGTTDITRTVALGKLTAQEKKDFTLVLKGHIALASCRFPHGTRGTQLEVLAKQYLWQHGMNYLHGTGHGIGHYLNVHEGPQNIRTEENPTLLLPGMVTSNEPGIYRTGEYGIRCENLILTCESHQAGFGKFYEFETLTLFPFDLNAIDESLLSPEETTWLNTYHQRVYQHLHIHLSDEEATWLKEKTRSI